MNIHLIKVSEEKNRKKWREAVFQEIAAGNFPGQIEDVRPQIQETQVIRRINKKEIYIQTHHMKLQNIQDKEVIFKSSQRKESDYLQRNNKLDFSEKQ